MAERRFYRLGAAAAWTGGALGIAFNALHAGPRRGSTSLFLADLADSDIWLLDNLGIAVSLVIVLWGLAAVSRSLEPAGWARFAWPTALVGVAVALVNVAVDGPAMKEVADAWAAATGARRDSLFAAADILRQVDVATFTMWSLVLTGLAPLAYGAAMLERPVYPRPLAWLALGAGALGVVSAAIQFFRGLTPLTVFVTFPIASGALLVWLIAAGTVMWRRADRLADC